MTARARRVAMFDSGLGGLSVYTTLREALPDADIVYAADTARMPYGDRPLPQVEAFARQMIAMLRRHDPSLLVIACGTSCSAFAASGFQPGLPTLAIVACGVAAAAAATAGGRIGVIATAATIGSGIFERDLLRARPHAVVTSVAAPKLVPLVEAGAWGTQAAASAVEEYCQPLRAASCDAVVLGCTHYPHLRRWFARSLGPEVRLVDPAQACADAAARALAGATPGGGTLTVLVSGDRDVFARRAFELSGVQPNALESADFSREVEEPEHSHR
ncbi:MAG: glutamate racemase [Candidatus Eremiobacteraeota bacterium]|nr:glutamate racemase [Candidatus Eremiobacteraeota bacterium]